MVLKELLLVMMLLQCYVRSQFDEPTEDIPELPSECDPASKLKSTIPEPFFAVDGKREWLILSWIRYSVTTSLLINKEEGNEIYEMSLFFPLKSYYLI